MNPVNYRPISNTCAMGKLLERCMFSQVMGHIKSLGLINPNHHGGLAQHSTSTCVAQIINDVEKSLESKKKTAVLAIDLSSAYDLVSHEILIEKCRLLQVGDLCLSWISNFLEGRSQYVEIGGVKSPCLPSGEDGVVQGGPSSGELFILFLNSLPVNPTATRVSTKETNTKVKDPANDASSNEFIDDLSSVISANTEEELNCKIKIEFQRIHDYLISHKMKINCEKTQLMYIHPTASQKKNPISLNESLIKHQEQIRILGFNIAENLKYDAHIKTGKINMIRSINSKMSMLRT